MENYQDDYEYEMIDLEPEEKGDEEQEHQCSCGHYCFNCLGMSWRDFI